MADRQYRYNIILLGDEGVGKSSLFNRIRTGKFHQNQSTLGQDNCEKQMTLEGDQIRVSNKGSIYCYAKLWHEMTHPCTQPCISYTSHTASQLLTAV